MKIAVVVKPLELNFLIVATETLLEQLRDTEEPAFAFRIEAGEELLKNLKKINRSYEIS